MSRGRPRKPVSEDRLVRKRLAARMRQRRCRERKKLAAQAAKQALDGNTQSDNVSQTSEKGPATIPSSPPQKIRVVHVPVPTHPAIYRGVPPYPHHHHHHHPHPMYMTHHMGMPPMPHPHAHHAMHPHYHHRAHYPVVPVHPHHHPAAHRPYTAATSLPQSTAVPRTISRTSSEVSVDGNSSFKSLETHKSEDKMQTPVSKKSSKGKNQKKVLASEEKTAVAAILSLKTTSSDEESSADDTASTSDETATLASECPDHLAGADKPGFLLVSV